MCNGYFNQYIMAAKKDLYTKNLEYKNIKRYGA